MSYPKNLDQHLNKIPSISDTEIAPTEIIRLVRGWACSWLLLLPTKKKEEGQQPLNTTDKVTHKPNRLFSLYSALYPAFEMTIARVTQCRDFQSATHPGTIPICTLKPDATLRAQTRRLITSILQQQSNDTMRWNVMRRKISDSRSIVCVRPQVLESSASP